MAKPNPAAIRATPSLTSERVSTEHGVCSLCGRPADPPSLWRECNEWDQPIPGAAALLLVCGAKECDQRIRRHPRLYVADSTGRPGSFPLLCGPCVHRRGLACAHPDLKENGGAGLRVTLQGPDGIVCGPGGCSTLPKQAVSCAGKTHLKLLAADSSSG